MKALSGEIWRGSRHGSIPRLTHSRPRATSLTGSGRALMALAVALLVAAVMSGPLLYGAAQRQARAGEAFQQNSQVIAGEVVRLRRSDDNHRVTYRFVVNGRAYESTARVSSSRYRGLRVGGPVRVRFLPDTPSIHRLDGTGDDGLPVALAFVAPVLLVAASGVLIWIVNRNRWLLTEGRLTHGVVVARKVRTTHDTKSYRVTYQFPLLDGRVAEGAAIFHRNPPPVGARIEVLYDPERPARSAIHPLAFLQPAE